MSFLKILVQTASMHLTMIWNWCLPEGTTCRKSQLPPTKQRSWFCGQMRQMTMNSFASSSSLRPCLRESLWNQSSTTAASARINQSNLLNEVVLINSDTSNDSFEPEFECQAMDWQSIDDVSNKQTDIWSIFLYLYISIFLYALWFSFKFVLKIMY